MIKAHVKQGEVHLEITGELPIICADACRILQTIYNAILENDEEQAELFKKDMETAFQEDVIFVRKEDEEERIADATERKIRELKKLMMEKVGARGAEMMGDLLESLRRSRMDD